MDSRSITQLTAEMDVENKGERGSKDTSNHLT